LDFQDHLEVMESLELEVSKVFTEKRETKVPEVSGVDPVQVVFKEFLARLEIREIPVMQV